MTPYQMYPISEALKCEEKNHYLGTAKICVTECLLYRGNKRAPFGNTVLSEALIRTHRESQGLGPSEHELKDLKPESPVPSSVIFHCMILTPTTRWLNFESRYMKNEDTELLKRSWFIVKNAFYVSS